jgi:hypothetical protein
VHSLLRGWRHDAPLALAAATGFIVQGEKSGEGARPLFERLQHLEAEPSLAWLGAWQPEQSTVGLVPTQQSMFR